MTVIDDNTIVYRCWDGFLTLLDLHGQIIKRYELPPGGGTAVSLFQYGEDIFLDYDYNNVKTVGLQYV